MDVITIIVITYNNEIFLPGFLKSLERIHKNKFNLEIFLIDNNSTDNTRVYLSRFSSKNPHVFFIKNPSNVGFAKAVNQGIKRSKGSHILLINPDSIVPPNSINKLYRHIETQPTCGIVGGELYDYKTSRPQFSHVSKPTFLVAIFEFTSLKKIIPERLNFISKKFWSVIERIGRPTLHSVWGVCGAFMIIKQEVIRKVGMFDENFFLYLEDLDFCIRAKKSGYNVCFFPNSFIYHLSGGSSLILNPRYRINEIAWRKSRRYFFKKHLHPLTALFITLVFRLEEMILDARNYLKKLTVDKL